MPLKVRAKFVEQKEKRLADMEPEKAEAAREKKRWQNAETRLKGEKVNYRFFETTGFYVFHICEPSGSSRTHCLTI